MKSYFIAIRLIFFVGVATILYIHASSVVGSDVTSAKNIIDMTSEESYKIWDAVNILEDNFYVMQPARKYTVGSEDVRNARGIVQSYEDLLPVFEQLIDAYKKSNLDKFAEQKEKIAVILRPMWLDAQYEEKEKRRRMSWLRRVKDNLSRAMNRLYIYFFPSTVAIKK